MKLIAPGIYADEKGGMEVDIPQVLKHLGFEDTEKNRDICVEMIEDVLREKGIVTPQTKTAHTHHHRCPRCSCRWAHSGKLKKCGLEKKATCRRCNS